MRAPRGAREDIMRSACHPEGKARRTSHLWRVCSPRLVSLGTPLINAGGLGRCLLSEILRCAQDDILIFMCHPEGKARRISHLWPPWRAQSAIKKDCPQAVFFRSYFNTPRPTGSCAWRACRSRRRSRPRSPAPWAYSGRTHRPFPSFPARSPARRTTWSWQSRPRSP